MESRSDSKSNPQGLLIFWRQLIVICLMICKSIKDSSASKLSTLSFLNPPWKKTSRVSPISELVLIYRSVPAHRDTRAQALSAPRICLWSIPTGKHPRKMASAYPPYSPRCVDSCYPGQVPYLLLNRVHNTIEREHGLATPHDKIFAPRCDDGKSMVWFMADKDMI